MKRREGYSFVMGIRSFDETGKTKIDPNNTRKIIQIIGVQGREVRLDYIQLGYNK